MTPTIHTYNQKAKEYEEETADFWRRFPRTFFDKFADHFKGGSLSKVLDVGSGPGRDGVLLTELGLDVTCLDASEAMVKLCEEKSLKAVLGEFSNLPFENNSFDGIWAYTSLLHIPKSEVSVAIKEIKRVLKEGGVFALGLIEGETEGYRENMGKICHAGLATIKKKKLKNC